MAAKQSTKSLSKANNFAKELKDRKYHQRVVRNKKAYDRKKKLLEIHTRSGEWQMSDV